VNERDSPLNRTSISRKPKKKAKSKPKKPLKEIDEGPEINIKRVTVTNIKAKGDNFSKSLYD
jgi:hypothetical protein